MAKSRNLVKPGWVDQLMDGIDHVKYLRPGTTLMAVAAHNNFQFSNKIYLPNTTANFFISLGYLDM